MNPIGTRACYDEGKRCAEAAFFSYREQYGLPIKVARIFNTYGPAMQPDDGRVVSNFMVQALRGKPLRVFGDGSQTRSFCYVDDLVDGLARLMDTPHDVTGPINLGNPDEYTIAELAELVLATVGEHRLDIEHGPLPADDPTRRCPNIEQAQWVLGWKPSTTMGEGLAATIAYFRVPRPHARVVNDVTVVIPSHNRRELLHRTLRSVLAQEDVALTVLVVDDGSADDTEASVEALHDPRVTVLRHPVPAASSAARNTGIARATTTWLAFVDDDDLWAPGKLRAQLDALAGDPGRPVVVHGLGEHRRRRRISGWHLPPRRLRAVGRPAGPQTTCPAAGRGAGRPRADRGRRRVRRGDLQPRRLGLLHAPRARVPRGPRLPLPHRLPRPRRGHGA